MVILMMPPSTDTLEAYVSELISGTPCVRVSNRSDLSHHFKSSDQPNDRKWVFVAELNNFGLNLSFMELVQCLMSSHADDLSGSTGMVIVKSDNQWHTKSFSSWLLFSLNMLGFRFPGHPVIEMTQGLENLNRWEKTTGLSRNTLLRQLGTKTFQRFLQPSPVSIEKIPRITALHASSRSTSNTLSLWNMTKEHLTECEVQDYHVANGTVLDCIGCPYQTCLYFGSQQSCFYGGDIVEELFPAIECSDALLWICPNYNDTLSANLMAVINRLTALYRTRSFYDKKIFAVIVSGNSGSDAVARQLIDALCINKGFHLPPQFCLTATAYDPGSIYQLEGIEKRAAEFAALILRELKNDHL